MLRVNNLTGFGGGGIEAFNYSQVYTSTQSPDTQATTFSNATLGAPNANRLLIIMVGAGVSSWSGDFSVTVGGESATVENEYSVINSGSGSVVNMSYIAYPNGTTADIVVTGPGGTNTTDIGISVFRVCGPTLPAIYDSAGEISSDPLTPSVNTPSGTSAVLVCAMSHNTTTITWSGTAEEVGTEDQIGGTITVGYGAGYSETAETPTTISANLGSAAQSASGGVSVQ